MEDLYSVLGVRPDADPAAIKKAHRQKASKAHPDKGGDPEEFLAVQRAYDVLSDAQRRKRYDETGDGSASSPNQEMTELIQIVLRVAANLDPDRCNLITQARSKISADIRELQRQTAAGEQMAARLARAAGRFTVKGDAPNVFAEAFKEREAMTLRSVAALKLQVEKLERLLVVLDSFDYRLEEVDPFGLASRQFMSASDFLRQNPIP